MGFSGYLSIYNDWDALGPALESMVPHLDELVVVDGAYTWMAPYLRTIGKDPERSDPEVYAILAELKLPVRVIARQWSNEIEKRLAGYEACGERHIFRIDADEVMFFHPGALERFLGANAAVGQMQMPSYVTPEWLQVASETSEHVCQCFLFDREQIPPADHLHYLWLVLGADALPARTRDAVSVFPEPIAYNAHLTAWRSPRTAVQRAGFYVTNYMRDRGVPWLPPLRGRPLEDFSAFFSLVSPAAFLDMLRGSPLVTGHTEIGKSVLRRSDLDAGQVDSIAPIYRAFLAGNAALNRELRVSPRHFVGGEPICLDVTSEENLGVLASDGRIELQVSVPLVNAACKATYLIPRTPWREELALPVKAAGDRLEIALTPEFEQRTDFLRRTITLQLWLSPGTLIGSMLCL